MTENKIRSLEDLIFDLDYQAIRLKFNLEENKLYKTNRKKKIAMALMVPSIPLVFAAGFFMAGPIAAITGAIAIGMVELGTAAHQNTLAKEQEKTVSRLRSIIEAKNQAYASKEDKPTPIPHTDLDQYINEWRENQKALEAQSEIKPDQDDLDSDGDIDYSFGTDSEQWEPEDIVFSVKQADELNVSQEKQSGKTRTHSLYPKAK